jgi:hypothetical protein
MVQVLFSSTFRETRLLSLKVSTLGNCRGVDMHQFGVDMHQFFFFLIFDVEENRTSLFTKHVGEVDIMGRITTFLCFRV